MSSRYRIRCVTDNKYEYEIANVKPTVCPVNAAHTIAEIAIVNDLAGFVSDRFYTDVSGLAEVTRDTVIPDGETWEIQTFLGSASYLDDTTACVVWDPTGANTMVGCTHGDAVTPISVQFVGDGVKVLRISLQNDTNTARIMGAEWRGEIV